MLFGIHQEDSPDTGTRQTHISILIQPVGSSTRNVFNKKDSIYSSNTPLIDARREFLEVTAGSAPSLAMAAQYLFLILALAGINKALVSKDGTTGRLPAMGWNSWNEYACNINESIFLNVGKSMVSLGLKDAGYNYVNIDDCWSDKNVRRDSSTGKIVPDRTKFPKGINGLADEMHKLGLKLGIYSDAGTSTCAGYAGSLGHEELDAKTFAEWGIDCK